ncbi:hypothetical protein DNL40_09640 [Xylanimonas oleitrophica]|uniref:Uncharacterized protein n=1 Tax=Xylanimonas oleitrophica TaxID=2607479 RepID=A0A2W5WP35_9MICO|nr:hypothetical protein [Xylanimonas oleitrophica]PZR52910.1 hypothetical protein DNL40_09640 [Xylanimonas oleitrophica]
MTRDHEDLDLTTTAEEESTVVVLLRSAVDGVEHPPAPDGAALAHSAVRRVRARRALLTAGVGTAAATAVVVTTALTGPWDAPPGPVASAPATPAAPAASAPAASAAPAQEEPAPEPTYLPVGDGELPLLPGVEHGAVDLEHSEYRIEGGLVYTMPRGGRWVLRDVDTVDASSTPPSMVWDVSTQTEWAQGAAYPEEEFEATPMAGSKATIRLDVAADAASWQVPDRDSGAWTVDVPGADLVVVTRGPAEEPGLARWDAQVRRGDSGWTIRMDFTDDEVGDRVAAEFLGNLWFQDDGPPEWFVPTHEFPVVDGIVHGVPEGWQEVSLGEVTLAVPAGWTYSDRTDEYQRHSLWEGDVATSGFRLSDGTTEDVRWSVLVSLATRGPSNDVPGVPVWLGPQPQTLQVPGADFAEADTTLGPFYADRSVRSYWTTIELHQAGPKGRNASVYISVPADEEGLEILRGVMGSVRFP